MLTRSQHGREMLEEIETEAFRDTHARRAALTAEVRTARARLDKEGPALLSAIEKAEKDRERANAAARDARARHADVANQLARLTNDVEQKVRQCETELAESADPALAAFVEEIKDGWVVARSRSGWYLGVNFFSCTPEGNALLIKAFLACLQRAQAMIVDGDITDAEGAIVSARQAFAEEIQGIMHTYAKERVANELRAQRERDLKLRVLEEDLRFKKRQGWPESELEAYRQAQLSAL
ncbi:MAG: hypothetical protein IPG88_26440 [Gemmatimonadetes bacterium]|nr:hypothetical protein [Gemmatimonadota bacterium]